MNRIAGISEKYYTALYKIYEDLHVWIWHLIGGPMNNINKNKTFAISFFKISISFYFFCILGYRSLSSHFLFEFLWSCFYILWLLLLFFSVVFAPILGNLSFFYVKMLTQNNFDFSLWSLALSDFRFLYLFYMLETFHVL